MKKYQSINQFKHLVKSVREQTYFAGLDVDGKATFDYNKQLPTLQFTATTKAHGTNAGVRLDIESNEITHQSRERELSIASDNAGFCMWASQEEVEEEFRRMFRRIKDMVAADDSAESIVIFGEWCGGNIQAGVAINGLPKMFLLFEVHVCYADERRERFFPSTLGLANDESRAMNIYDITQFGLRTININFEKPEEIQNTLVDMCMKIENECPIGKHFGKSGIGEGFVMVHHSNQYGFLQAKIKGEKHSNSKVKTVAAVDVEKYAKVDAFVEDVLQTPRLEQGLKYLEEMEIPFEIKNVGQYIHWVTGDIMKEEMDTIVANQLDTKIIANKAGNIARKFYISKLEA